VTKAQVELGTPQGMVPYNKFVKLVLEDERDLFLLHLTERGDHYISFDVYEVVSWDEDWVPGDIEPYLSGMIKWDGCSHINFGEIEDGARNGYMHLCGVHAWVNHCLLMRELWDYAKANIRRWDDNTAGCWSDDD
jgi:hypothetical protein